MNLSNSNLSKGRLDRFLSRRRGERPVHAIEPLVFLSRDDFYRRQEQIDARYKIDHRAIPNTPLRFTEQKRKREELDKENKFGLSEEHAKKLTRIHRGQRTTLHATEEFVIRPYIESHEKPSPKQQQQQEKPKRQPMGDKTMKNTRQSSVSTQSVNSAAPRSVVSMRSSGAQSKHSAHPTLSMRLNDENAIAHDEILDNNKKETLAKSAHSATKSTTALSERSIHSITKSSIADDKNSVVDEDTSDLMTLAKKTVMERFLGEQFTKSEIKTGEAELGQEDDIRHHDISQKRQQQQVAEIRTGSAKDRDDIDNKRSPKFSLTEPLEHDTSGGAATAEPLDDEGIEAYADKMSERDANEMVTQTDNGNNKHDDDISQKPSAPAVANLSDRVDEQPHQTPMHKTLMDPKLSTSSGTDMSKHYDDSPLQKSPIADPAHNDDDRDENNDRIQDPIDTNNNNDNDDDMDFDIVYDYGDDNSTNVSAPIDRRASSPQERRDLEEQQHQQEQDNHEQQGSMLPMTRKPRRGKVSWDGIAVSNLVSTRSHLDEAAMEALRQEVYDALRITAKAYRNRGFVQALRDMEVLAFQCGEEFRGRNEYHQRASDITVGRIKDAFSHQATLCRKVDELRYKTQRVKALQDQALKRMLAAQTERHKLHGQSSRLHKAYEKLHGTNEVIK
ncbi:hypothetical protein BDB00DRAFT_816561 [Zychaea mexicana]|uniref:uncharacterized protein n=1 Tax=Zychaea mexicana TaxID=64656 RepID=UPI0022FED167|nr:uncharacterized protein BDB00DRAFT_816561 [Zychaea mexicana]KAI9494982.1 hypothetical protein BDB00DRAFT_816561 [Zychaea mexicana]